jgi:phage tail sheath protein FI
MPEYLSPGVYIEEIPGPQPIEGVSTSTTGMVGVTRMGPADGKPRYVESFSRFREIFGGYLSAPSADEQARLLLDDRDGSAWWRFPLAVKGFFDNGGQRLYVKRVVSATAVTSEVVFPSGPIAIPPAERPDELRVGPPPPEQPPRNYCAPWRWRRGSGVTM